MSRILRRPMFRGGRVDGRGTGITSGLGYAKGGQVQPLLVGQHPDEFKDAEGREQHWNPLAILGGIGSLGMRYGPRAWQAGKHFIRPGGKARKLWQSKWNPLSDPLIGGAGKYTIGAPLKGAHKFAKWSPWGAAGVGAYALSKKDELKDLWDEYWPWGDEPDKPLGISQGEANAMFGEGTELANRMAGRSRAEVEAVLKQKLDLEKQALLDEENKTLEEQLLAGLTKKKTKKEKLAELKENKAMLREMYGSGIADDASRMAMSYAGRLLEEGADVKSATGKFLTDESKVEGKRSKYKDAATTAAINAYLTGEKDYDSMMKQMKIIDYQIDKKADAAKGVKESLSFAEIKAGLPGTMKDREKTKTAAELFVQYTDKGKTFTVIDKDEDTDALLKAPENEGQYFMNRETKQVFKILKGIKQIIYSG